MHRYNTRYQAKKSEESRIHFTSTKNELTYLQERCNTTVGTEKIISFRNLFKFLKDSKTFLMVPSVAPYRQTLKKKVDYLLYVELANELSPYYQGADYTYYVMQLLNLKDTLEDFRAELNSW